MLARPQPTREENLGITSQRPGSRMLAAVVYVLLSLDAQTNSRASAEDKINVSFDNRGAHLVGTIRIPERDGKLPGLVIVHGSGAETRNTSRIFQDHFVQTGYIVFAYDKRGVGESTGVFVSGFCNTCPDNVNLLASDASAALTLLASRPEVDPQKVGFWGASQGGWIVPHAALTNGHAAFMILDSGPTVSSQRQLVFQRFVESRKLSDHMTPDAAERLALRSEAPLDIPVFDPLPDLRSLNIPGLWVFGDQDWSVPPSSSIAALRKLADAGKPYQYRLIAGAGHVVIGQRPEELWRNVDEWLARTLYGN